MDTRVDEATDAICLRGPVSIPDGSSSPLSLLITIFLPDSRQQSVNSGQCDIGAQAGNFAITSQPTKRACSYVDIVFPVSVVALDVMYKLFSWSLRCKLDG
jgi:hypothetical protein